MSGLRRPGAALVLVLLTALGAGAVASVLSQPASNSGGVAPTPTQPALNSEGTAPVRTQAGRSDGTAPATPTQAAPSDGGVSPTPTQPAPMVNRASYLLDATYAVHVHLNWAAGTLDVTTDMEADNRSGGAISRLELNTIAVRLGSMKLVEATVDGADVKPRLVDQTIVVRLPEALPSNGHVSVHTRYRATLRHSFAGSNWLWSQRDGVAAVHRFIPWLSRRTPFDRPNHGDPFVTPVASAVRVRFTSSVPLVFATSGVEVASTQPGITYDALEVRDFAFSASRTYRVLKGRTLDGDSEIRVLTRWARPGQARHMLEVAQRAIAKYESWVGQLPYPSITLAETAGGTAMESPGLVWIPREVANLDYLIAHELGHQWFYGVVGNDQAAEPFLDEAMTDFLARRFLGQLRASRCPTDRLDRTIYAYSGTCYYETIYVQGAQFVDDIRRDMGNTRFWNTVRAFWADNRLKVSSTFALLEAFRAVTGTELLPSYRKRFPSLYPS